MWNKYRRVTCQKKVQKSKGSLNIIDENKQFGMGKAQINQHKRTIIKQ